MRIERVPARVLPDAAPTEDRQGPHAPAVAAPAASGSAWRRALAATAPLAALLGYALVRYAVLAREPLASVPLWMTNKAVAVFAVALVAGAALRPRAPWRGWARSVGLGAAALHAVSSLALLRPAYYAALFEGGPAGRMTAAGELAILCGVAALAVLVSLRPRPARAGARSRAWLAAAGGALVAAHCAALGLPRWLAPGGWPGGLPPMSLLGALLALVPATVSLVVWTRRRAGERRLARLRAMR
ncbi:MAG TPA: hypothetical protein VFL83_15060 [Anaeromyxobacter sp.]|nr:hypothetical protein [Anaeromyxobacter sp.]